MRAPPRVAVSDLLASAVSRLKQRQVRCALVGAAALSAHGVEPASAGVELLVVSPAVLAPEFWKGLEGAESSIHPTGAGDPLAGTVRLARGGDVLEVLVGKQAWQQDLVVRARPRQVEGTEVPVASVVDLIVLELWAGDAEDVEDVKRLLAITDRESITEQVDARLNQLPPECARLWRKVLREG